MRWRGWTVGGLILGLMLGSWSTVLGAATPAPVETVTIAVPDEPPRLDPTTSPAAAIARMVYNNLLEGLVKVNMQGEIVGALAERYSISIDGTVHTFTLRYNVKFHNGRALTAEDVKYTLERNLDPKIGHPHRAYYEDIQHITSIDEHTLHIALRKPNAMFIFNLAWANSAIITKKEVERLKSHPVGTDPFQLRNGCGGIASVGLCLTGALFLTALASLFYTPHDSLAISLDDRLQGPSSAHWFGTDQFGRDVLSRIMLGAVVSMNVGLIAVAIGLKEAQSFLLLALSYAIFPGAAIVLAVLGCNLLGDGLRDVFDPKVSR